jgi:hypothetical protein
MLIINKREEYMKNRQKTCTHCGNATHPQPQDPNHDTGYGHCYTCLNKKDWYVKSHDRPNLFMWESLDRCGGNLTGDDSHAKVVEFFHDGELINHFTSYLTKEKLREWANAKIVKLSSTETLNG